MRIIDARVLGFVTGDSPTPEGRFAVSAYSGIKLDCRSILTRILGVRYIYAGNI